MDEQDKKILELYLNDMRKKKLFFLFIAIFLIVSILFYGFYAKYKNSSNEIDNSIQEETETNIINENNTNEETTNIDNTVDKENTENKVDEAPKEENQVTNEENTKQETQEQAKVNTQTTTATSESKKNESTKEKPKNKDFLFSDGYTMDNVTQAALDYLKSKDYSGECIPIKDNEGVYLGMRVIFY